MIHHIWLTMVFAAVLWGAVTDHLDRVAKVLLDNANTAAEILLGLLGTMTLWLGVMKIVEYSGLAQQLARIWAPLMGRLFPDIPSHHPVMSAMMMNICANVLGLGNAATPFGLRAMEMLRQLNPHPGVASPAMVTFLAINTSGLALLPTGMVALRSALGSEVPAAIILPTILASTVGLLVSLLLSKGLAPFYPFLPTLQGHPGVGEASSGEKEPTGTKVTPIAHGPFDPLTSTESAADEGATTEPTVIHPPGQPLHWTFWLLCMALLVAFGIAFGHRLTHHQHNVLVTSKEVVTHWPILILFVWVLLFGIARRIQVYDVIVEGGKQGFQIFLQVLPYFVPMLVAIGMVRQSGLLEALLGFLAPVFKLVGMPGEVVPMVLMRPLSGQGSYGLAAELMKIHGPDSLLGWMASTMNGSSETTFYVLSLYYGVARVQHMRHTLWVCLTAELTAMFVAIWACRWLF